MYKFDKSSHSNLKKRATLKISKLGRGLEKKAKEMQKKDSANLHVIPESQKKLKNRAPAKKSIHSKSFAKPTKSFLKSILRLKNLPEERQSSKLRTKESSFLGCACSFCNVIEHRTESLNLEKKWRHDNSQRDSPSTSKQAAPASFVEIQPIVDNCIVDARIVDNRIVDTRIVDRRIVNTWIVDLTKDSHEDLPRTSLIDLTKTGLVDLPKISHVDSPKTSLVDLPKTSLVDLPKTSHMDSKRSSHMDSKKTSLVDSTKTSPVDLTKISHMDSKKTSLVDSTKTSLVDLPETSQVDLTKNSIVELMKNARSRNICIFCQKSIHELD